MNMEIEAEKLTGSNLLHFTELYKELLNVANEVKCNSLKMQDVIKSQDCETNRHIAELNNIITHKENEITKLNHL